MNKKGKISAGVALATVLLVLFPPEATARIKVVDGVPQGFEHLNGPRNSVVSLYYGGNLVFSYRAEVSPDYIRFLEPQKIAEDIPAIKDKGEFAQVMAAPLPHNADKLCTSGRNEGCGRLAPEDVGVIYDDNRLTVELFINPRYAGVTEAGDLRYLPLPERSFSSVYNFNGAVSGMDDTKPNFAVSNNFYHSYGESMLNLVSTVNNEGLRFDTATMMVERNGWRAGAGLFRSRGMQLASDHDMAGVTYSTSTRTLLDEYQMEGSQIILYLPRRSFVSIYRDGRLYSSRAYEAGNQSISTAELPEGAYNITLKVQEPDGSVREEQRFFAKSPDLPPPGEPVYYAEAGVIREHQGDDSVMPELSSDPILRLGTIHRIAENSGLEASAVAVKDKVIFEPGIFYMIPELQLKTTGLISTDSDYGIQFTATHICEEVSAIVDFREIWADEKNSTGFDALVREVTQATVNASYAVSHDFAVGARANYTEFYGSEKNFSYGPYATWRLWSSGEAELGLSADFARNGDRDSGSILLRFSKRLGEYGVSGTGGYSFSEGSDRVYGSARVWHDRVSPDEALLLGAGMQADNYSKSLNADADWRNRYGRVRGGVQKSFGGSDNALTYGGNFSINAAQQEGKFVIGGDQNDNSAVIIQVEGEDDAEMSVFINGFERGSVRAGESHALYLNPFRVYKIRLAAKPGDFYDYDSGERLVTLYPGNAVKLKWQIRKLQVVAAKLVDEDGNPVTFAVLEQGNRQVATNSKGFFQAEIPVMDELTFSRDGEFCTVNLPRDVEQVNNITIYREPLICR